MMDFGIGEKQGAEPGGRDFGKIVENARPEFRHERTFIDPVNQFRMHGIPAAVLQAVGRIAGGEAITTIAHDLGYGSSAAFTSMFRRALGVPPRRYAVLASENDGRGA